MDGLWKSCEGLAAAADELQLPSEPRRPIAPKAQCHRTGTVMPIHRHKGSSETCVCVRGHFEEYFYDEAGNLTDAIDMVPGGTVLNIEKGQWHSLKCLESGTVLLVAMDGPYAPLAEDEVMKRGMTLGLGKWGYDVWH